MGFVEGDTWVRGLSDGARCESIGRAMDRHMMACWGGYWRRSTVHRDRTPPQNLGLRA